MAACSPTSLWRWRQHVPPKRWHPPSAGLLHGHIPERYNITITELI
jgi:hypothetical protein